MTNKLLPLEYCRIGRAARLLGCEVEDILHWASLGMIEACVFLSGEEVTPTFYRDDDKGRAVRLEGSAEEREGQLFELNEELFRLNKGYTRPQVGHYSEAAMIWDGSVYPRGPWAISPTAAADIIAGKPRPLAGELLWPAGDDKPKGLSIHIRMTQDDGSLIDEDQIWIVRDDLERLAGAMKTGKRLSVLPHLPQRKLAEAAASTPNNKLHGNAEHNAAKRVDVLSAALCAVMAWPDELVAGTGREVGGQAIADLVSNHEAALFDSGKATLSASTMTDLFNAALGRVKRQKTT